MEEARSCGVRGNTGLNRRPPETPLEVLASVSSIACFLATLSSFGEWERERLDCAGLIKQT
jgi:hypothetical protein